MHKEITWSTLTAAVLLLACGSSGDPSGDADSGAETSGGPGSSDSSGETAADDDTATTSLDTGDDPDPSPTTGGPDTGDAATSEPDTGETTTDPSTTGDDPSGDPPPPLEQARVVGYFPAWSVYARDFHVAEIHAERLTHINYAFANLDAQGHCVLGDAYADIDKFYDGDSWDEGSLRGSFHQLQLLKENHPHLRTMISVGGWTWSANFSPAAATAQSRAALASSCVEFMRTYGFDGIDIDWEYPVGGGLDTNQTSPNDTHNYTLLLAELRAQLDAAGGMDGKDYELSIAAPAGAATIPNLEAGPMSEHLSHINVMAYDFYGGWSPQTDFNAPLVGSLADPDSQANSIDAAVTTYLAAGVPASKLVVGTPFYGRGWKGVTGGDNGLHAAHDGLPMGTWEAGVFDYVDLVNNYLPTYERHWHEQAQVPWLYNPTTGIMISYDDEQSIGLKADYIREHQLGGAMVWELSGDTPDGALLTVLADTLLP